MCKLNKAAEIFLSRFIVWKIFYITFFTKNSFHEYYKKAVGIPKFMKGVIL